MKPVFNRNQNRVNKREKEKSPWVERKRNCK